MNRNNFLKLSMLGIIGLHLECKGFSYSGNSEIKRYLFETNPKTQLEVPEGKRSPFGWEVSGIDTTGINLSLRSTGNIPTNKIYFLRISIGIEVWENKVLQARIPGIDKMLGSFDVRYSPVLTPFQIEIEEKYIEEIQKKGIELVLVSGKDPLWIFDNQERMMPDSFRPHLLVVEKTEGSIQTFLSSFKSLSSIQSFGWREGCVLDGLLQLYKEMNDKEALVVARNHLDMFLHEGKAIHEDAWSKPLINQFGTIEATLPFATLAYLDPDHPVFDDVEKFWMQKKKSTGEIVSRTTITAEGCYTVAYPIAMLAAKTKRKDLSKIALEQLKVRKILFEDGDFYLGYYPENKERMTKNWARGIAWYLLGQVRTLSCLKETENIEEYLESFQAEIHKVISLQQPSGLWNCFADDFSGYPDTSGSAGIAAAIACGVREGFLPDRLIDQAKKAWDGLIPYLTADGFLGGVAQDNRGGIVLQAGDYRVIAQMGMGLMAQLYAVLNGRKNKDQ